MINLDDITKENDKEHNKNGHKIPDHPYRIFITGDSGSGKINALLNVISLQDDLFICKRFKWTKIWIFD